MTGDFNRIYGVPTKHGNENGNGIRIGSGSRSESESGNRTRVSSQCGNNDINAWPMNSPLAAIDLLSCRPTACYEYVSYSIVIAPLKIVACFNYQLVLSIDL